MSVSSTARPLEGWLFGQTKISPDNSPNPQKLLNEFSKLDKALKTRKKPSMKEIRNFAQLFKYILYSMRNMKDLEYYMGPFVKIQNMGNVFDEQFDKYLRQRFMSPEVNITTFVAEKYLKRKLNNYEQHFYNTEAFGQLLDDLEEKFGIDIATPINFEGEMLIDSCNTKESFQMIAARMTKKGSPPEVRFHLQELLPIKKRQLQELSGMVEELKNMAHPENVESRLPVP